MNSDSDNPYNIRRNENHSRIERQQNDYDTYDQIGTNQRLSNRQNYDRNSQNNYSPTSVRQAPHDDLSTSGRRFRDDRQDNPSERADVTYRPRVRIVPVDDQTVDRQGQLSDQIQRTPKVEYTINQNPSANPRSIVLDISISINVAGSRNPQITASANALPARSSSIRSSAIIDDVGFVDLDIRSPDRTARLATDGIIRSSPSKQSSTVPNNNDK